MKFSVIYNKDLPIERQDKYIPLNWPMYLNSIKENEVTSGGLQIISFEDLANLKDKLWPEYERLQKEKEIFFRDKKVRILDLIHFDFKDVSLSKIDFTIHLKSGIFLKKTDVIMTKNGRPSKSVYYYDNDKIAEIIFEFENDVDSYMTKRIEKLGYYCLDDSILEYYVTSLETFSGLVPYQHQKRVSERTQSRKFIMDSLRADIDRMLKAASGGNPIMATALAGMINTFWVEYNPHIEAFISSGGTFLRSKFLAETKYSFLNSLVAPNVTVRMYIADKLTY